MRLDAVERTNANKILTSQTVRPKSIARKPLSQEVPPECGKDYQEACLVLADSEKASAALSRRCLQYLLREHVGVKHSDLANEIQQVLDAGKLPSHLAEGIDAIRNIGNFAAHPTKSQHTIEIFDVEPGEAEWSLDVLEGLFDFYFVPPFVTLVKRPSALLGSLAAIRTVGRYGRTKWASVRSGSGLLWTGQN
jgi:Domain of unknown function (DUF4145)